MGHDIVWLLHHGQRVAFMTLLTARLALATRTEAFGFGLFQAVGGRRFTAIAAVLCQATFEMFDISFAALKSRQVIVKFGKFPGHF